MHPLLVHRPPLLEEEDEEEEEERSATAVVMASFQLRAAPCSASDEKW